MSSSNKKTWQNTTGDEADILAILENMEADKGYHTVSKYHNDATKYPGNVITFSQVHITYLKRFPLIDPHQYIQNLRLSTKLPQ